MKKLIQSLKKTKTQLEKTICERDDIAHADTWDCPIQRNKYNEKTDTLHHWLCQVEDMIDELSATEEESRVVFS